MTGRAERANVALMGEYPPADLLGEILREVVGPLPRGQRAEVEVMPHATHDGFTLVGVIGEVRGGGHIRFRTLRIASREVSGIEVLAYRGLFDRLVGLTIERVRFLGYELRGVPAKPPGYRLLRRRSAPRHALGW